MIRFLILAAILICLPSGVVADGIESTASKLDAADQARAEVFFRSVKCPACAGQSLAESDLEVSKSLRAYIVRQIEIGKTDEEIEDALVRAFGESILLKPRWNEATFMLWIAPILISLGVGLALFPAVFKRTAKKGAG